MSIRFPLVALSTCLGACAVAPEVADRDGPRAASFEPAAGAGPMPAVASAAEPVVLDAVSVELLAQALATTERARQAHLANLANAHTVAYKRRIPVIDSSTLPAGSVSLTAPTFRTFAPVFTQGAIEGTENQFDVAIDGEGFFAVALSDGGTGYTRAGSLTVDAEGRLVSSTAGVLQPSITLPPDLLALTISPDGRVSGRTAGVPDTDTRFGQLTLCRFPVPAALRDVGQGVFAPTEASGAPVVGVPGVEGFGRLQQTFLERSNVDADAEQLALQNVERQRR